MSDNSLGQTTKEALKNLAIKVDESLMKYWDSELKKDFGFGKAQKTLVRQVLEHAKEHNLRSAKRIRAAFVYYGYWLSGKKPNEELWKVMEGVELVQTALLMHDDFMDEDKLRRGKPTTQEYFGKDDKHYGDSMAVSVGDAVLCLGYERVLDCGLKNENVLKAAKILFRGITNTALGQIYDVTLPRLGNLTEEKVLAVHQAKTAIYTFQNPLVIGGVLSKLPEKILDILKKYSLKGGVAFQLQDDVLGMFGETEKTGKSIDSDILQGKSTLLIAKTFELGNDQHKKALIKAWGNKEATAEEINKAKEAVRESGSLEYSIIKARALAKEAYEIAESLNQYSLNREAIEFLMGVAEYIVDRDL